MLMVKNILVATDFSEASDGALVLARELAKVFGSTLHVLHVTGNVVAGAIGVEGYTTDFAALQREVDGAAHRQLDRVITEEDRRTLGARAVVRTSGSPAESIASYAKDEHIDLLVVGVHHDGATHSLMGSVAERVVHLAPCPVLMVRYAAVESRQPESAHA
jgi:nucleotide-binding universal stress UspA family protein